MLELRPLRLSVVACLSPHDMLDRLRADGALAFRVAADEMLLLSAYEEVEAVVAAASAQLGPAAVVVDHTDAFVAWTLSGDGAQEALSRVSALPLNGERPFQQGLVAHVPAKLILAEGQIHVLVPSTLGHHLRQRVRDVSADLRLCEREPVLFEPGALEGV